MALAACSTAKAPLSAIGDTSDADYTPAYKLPSVTKGYKIVIYPSVGAKFNPHPTLTPDEFTDLSQLDWYANDQLKDVARDIWKMVRTGLTYGVLEGVLTMLGAMTGFGAAIKPLQYLAYGGLSSLGGGLANAEEQFQYTMTVAKGYLMTLLVQKADELDNQLERIMIVPLLAGQSPTPQPDPTAKDPYADNGNGATIRIRPVIVPPPG